MNRLTLRLKAEYFTAIKSGDKPEEFRQATPYWRKRLEKMRPGDMIVLTLGYPPRGDTARTIVTPWVGMRETTITHPHFGATPVNVFAIDVRNAADVSSRKQAGRL